MDGGLTRGVFELYLERMLLPALRPGQVLVLDNFVIHHGERVEALVHGAGCKVLYLPAYSPDLNPTLMLFSKLKAYLRRATAVTLSALSMAVKEALDAVSLSDIQGFYRAAGIWRQQL